MLCAHRAGLIDILSGEINLIMCSVTAVIPIILTLIEKLRNHCTKLESSMLLPIDTRHAELHTVSRIIEARHIKSAFVIIINHLIDLQ